MSTDGMVHMSYVLADESVAIDNGIFCPQCLANELVIARQLLYVITV